MWQFIKHKLTKLGCLSLIALTAIAATAITKLVLGWFQYDDASKNALGGQVGEYLGKGILGLVVLFGFILMGRQLIAELRGKSSSPPPLPPSSSPPPLPPGSLPSSPELHRNDNGLPNDRKRPTMWKGCLIAVGCVLLILCAAVLAINLLAREYEKQPKKPGEAELWTAETFIRDYDGNEGSGNSPEAAAFAQDYARKLRTSRQILFTAGKAGGPSMTEGHFLTYCFQGSDSIALLVHVPELRHYADDAKVNLGEYAWTLAMLEARDRFPQMKRLAVGIKGALDYSTIFTGVITEQDPITGIRERHSPISTKPLYPFFTITTKEEMEANTAPK